MSARSMKSRRVRVYVRTRPTEHFANDMIEFLEDGKSVAIHSKKDSKRGVVNNQLLDWSFKLDGILHNSSQEEVYSEVASDMITQLLNGYNATLMCYGQTGAGKTFTITGATENYKHRGIIPRVLAQVYKEIEERQDHAITVRISYMEIYNETMFDLLSTLPDPESFTSVPQMVITEDEYGNVSVKGLSVHLANTEEEALNFLFEGETNRTIAAHSLNQLSSRSHCVFTVHIESRSRTESNATYIKSKLNLVDLAGSERLGKTGSAGKTQIEAMYINKSLSFLEQTVIALADRRREHIPYRQTKLTHALKDSIGGNCNTVMIANIWGEVAQIEETISTLRFATRMMCVSNEPAINEYHDPILLVKKLSREIQTLKQELAMHDTLTNRSQVTYDALSDNQMYEIQNQVRLYLDGSLDEVDIVNIRQIKAVFESFKTIVNQMESEVEMRLKAQFTLIDKSDPVAIAAAQKAGVVFDDTGSTGYVGEVDRQSFGIGVAPSVAKPSSMSSVVQSARKLRSRKGKERGSPQSKSGMPASPAPSAIPTEPALSPTRQVALPPDTRESLPDLGTTSVAGSQANPPLPEPSLQPRPSTPPLRTVAFEEFKQERGSEINRILVENKEILAQKKKQCKLLAGQVNGNKQEIDNTRLELDKKRSERAEQGEFVNEDGETVIDEEEYLLIKKMRELKMSYRSDFDELRSVKSELQYCQKLVDQCRQRLITEFDNWYSESFLPQSEDQNSAQAGFGGRLGTQYNSTEVEDEGERFERLQNEILMENPESVSFYHARMRTDRRLNFKEAENQTQPFNSNKRVPGTPTITIKNQPPSLMTVQN